MQAGDTGRVVADIPWVGAQQANRGQARPVLRRTASEVAGRGLDGEGGSLAAPDARAALDVSPEPRSAEHERVLVEIALEAAEDRARTLQVRSRRAPPLVVFDDVIVGSTAVPTDPSFDEVLAGWDALALEVVVSQLVGSGTTLTVTIEHSAQRRHWLTRSTPISGAALSATDVTGVAGSDTGATPSLGFVRLSIRLVPFASSPSARVRVVVTGRDR